MDILKHYGFVFTGSQESILHLDIEEVAAFGFGVDSPRSPRGRIQQQLREQQASAPPPDQPQQQLQTSNVHNVEGHQPVSFHLQQDCSQHCPDEDSIPEQSVEEQDEAQRPVSPGALSSASNASGSSSCSGHSGSSVTDSILPQMKRSHIVGCMSAGPIRNQPD